MKFAWLWIPVLIFFAGLSFGPGFAQPRPERGLPQPVRPRSVGTRVRPEVSAYRKLQSVRSFRNRLDACEKFVDRFPGTQLALRVMREAAELYILRKSDGPPYPLETCATWMGEHLNSPSFSWKRYRDAPNSVFLDRLETHLMYARILASSRTYRGGRLSVSSRTYDRALRELTRVTSEGEERPDLLKARQDLVEQINLTRCWCLHGKEDYRAALKSYEWFLEKFPESDFTLAVLFNAASCIQALEKRGDVSDPRETDRKIAFYRHRLLDEYPGSVETVRLRQQLQAAD